ncbi:hypothetical protein V6N13_076848 [Hibiscus sabdariffa]|uniref:Uncharacterized protein n=1 Tax=Hibiscus sabdariffa TaxID=183260 RepID=A0ABR1ZWT4_9ROSI
MLTSASFPHCLDRVLVLQVEDSSERLRMRDMLDGGCENLVSRLGVIRLVMAVMSRGCGGELLGLVLRGLLVMTALVSRGWLMREMSRK